jgi:hypothetical protein
MDGLYAPRIRHHDYGIEFALYPVRALPTTAPPEPRPHHPVKAGYRTLFAVRGSRKQKSSRVWCRKSFHMLRVFMIEPDTCTVRHDVPNALHQYQYT